MFYMILRLLHEEMESGIISPQEYHSAVVKAAVIHGIRRNGIR
ncbi:MAG TPA: hypothetical protein VLM75_00580 [Spirochaetota bacterium]|nr:hypothetical protein [Spirochaetota bacterium]